MRVNSATVVIAESPDHPPADRRGAAQRGDRVAAARGARLARCCQTDRSSATADGWLAALALELGSCIGFVVVFRLFFDELPAGAARELAWTEEASGALLPGGGVGALAIGGLLLRRAGVSTRRIVERSSALFFLTSAVNVAALVGAGTLVAVGVAGGPYDPCARGSRSSAELLPPRSCSPSRASHDAHHAPAVRAGSWISAPASTRRAPRSLDRVGGCSARSATWLSTSPPSERHLLPPVARSLSPRSYSGT